jgi:hypothetical protein
MFSKLKLLSKLNLLYLEQLLEDTYQDFEQRLQTQGNVGKGRAATGGVDALDGRHGPVEIFAPYWNDSFRSHAS